MPKTTIPQITVFNVETGEEIVRDANAEEIAQIEKDVADAKLRHELKVKAEADKAALLARLGLTEDELKTILG
jgi:hypothetical protein